MTIFESRWQNAIRWAKRVNHALAEGNLVFVGEGERRYEIEAPLQIYDNQIFGPFAYGGKCGTVWFRNDPECDDGSHTEIDEWDVRNKITCYAAVAILEAGDE